MKFGELNLNIGGILTTQKRMLSNSSMVSTDLNIVKNAPKNTKTI
jgi:hypothetical protein